MIVSYASRLIGKIHFLLLAIMVVLSVSLFINQLSYDFSYGFYYTYLSSFDQVIDSFQYGLFVVVIISFLFWMLRVHTALRRVEPQYPINELEFIVRMLPIVQIWGIASTFNQMSNFFARHPLIAQRAMRIKAMVVTIYILYFGTFIITLVANVGWGGAYVTYISLLGYLVMSMIFILVTHWVNQYLYTCVIQAPEPLPVRAVSSVEFTSAHSYSSVTTVSSDFPQDQLEEILPQFALANIWIRLAAKAIEFVIFIVLTFASILPGLMHDSPVQIILVLSVVWVSWIIYLAIHLTINGQTIGKWLMRIKIVRADTGEEGGFVHNFLIRSFANYIIGSVVPFYSLVDILFIFSKDARCIHDRLASTQVIQIHR